MEKEKIVLAETSKEVGETKKDIKVADSKLNIVERKGKVVNITLGDKESFKNSLPDDLKPSVVEKVYKHTKKYIDDSVEQHLDAIEKTLEKDEKIDVVNVHTPFGLTGNDSIETSMQRSVKINNPAGEPYNGPKANVKVSHRAFMPTKTMIRNKTKELRSKLND